MAKDQALKLEILSAKHDGLLLAVDVMFDRFETAGQVALMIQKEYGETIHRSSIRTYKLQRWNVQKEAVQEQKTQIKALNEIIGEDGLGAAANALLWQEMQKMTTAEKINLKKVVNDDQKVALLKKQFALAAQEQRLKIEQRRAALNEGKEVDEEPDPAEEYAKAQRVVQQVKDIFGIGRTGARPPNQRFLRPAEETPCPTTTEGAVKAST